jgi:hypothetical protein
MKMVAGVCRREKTPAAISIKGDFEFGLKYMELRRL